MLNKLNKLNKFHSKSSGLRAALALRFDEGSVDSRLVYSRAVNPIATYVDSNGDVQISPHNFIRNSTMVGAVAGTPGTDPTNWTISPQGATQTISLGTVSSREFINYRFNGATTFPVTIGFDSTTGIPALSGDVFTVSVWLSLEAGDFTNVSNIKLQFRERDAAGVQIQSVTGPGFKASITSTPQKFTYTATLSGGATTAHVLPTLQIADTGNVDYTLQVSAPQISNSPTVLDYVPTTTQAEGAIRLTHTPAGVPLGVLLNKESTNILFNSLTPATQTQTIVNATQYTTSLIGTGSLVLSGGLTGTVTEGNPVTATSTSTSATFTLTGAADGIQCELGSVATSVIPTAGVAVTRAADSLTLPDVTMVNQAEGTIVVQFIYNAAAAAAGFPNIVSLNNGTANNEIKLFYNAGAVTLSVMDGGVAQALISAGTLADGDTVKVVASYKANSFKITVNGSAIVTDNAGTVPTVDRWTYGNNAISNNAANTPLAFVDYYNRQLSDTQLQKLST